jgi:hypothetical protein
MNDDFKDLVYDDSTTVVYVDTPEGWKCPRKGCTTEFIHEHSTYGPLRPSSQ